jgi:hypothetical protein
MLGYLYAHYGILETYFGLFVNVSAYPKDASAAMTGIKNRKSSC